MELKMDRNKPRPFSRYFARAGYSFTLLILLLGGCDEDGEKAWVTISGQHSVIVGKTLALAASTTGGVDTDYTWTSRDPTIATVNNVGLVTAVKTGETRISATGMGTGETGTHPLVVTEPGRTMVTITGNFFVAVGSSTKLTAETLNGSDTEHTWSSSNTAVATVTSDGTVSGRAVGQVTIKAVGNNSRAEGTVGIVVMDAVPNYQKWLSSGHADVTSEAFTHWNESNPPEIPTTCAKCHSTSGFLDFIGADGSASEKVDKAAKVGTVIGCKTCHNSVTDNLYRVMFPSGVEVKGLGPEARCMTCHQGRSTTQSVVELIEKAKPKDDDTVIAKARFIEIHNGAAGAILNGGRVGGGYQYTDKSYDHRFRHVKGKDTCVDCHDAHSLQVKSDTCKTCHAGVQSAADLRKIRSVLSSSRDFDGDGDIKEGIAEEIKGLHDKLLIAIQSYAKVKKLDQICFAKAYPYFFKDTDGDASCSKSEGIYSNAYAAWTGRLLRAAYNYYVVVGDPGAFAHNAKYVIQLLYDSIEDLNTVLTEKIDLSKAARVDPGHFDGSAYFARHWDKEGKGIPSSCSKCHGGSVGFRFFVEHKIGTDLDETSNGVNCDTCHDSYSAKPKLVAIEDVTFPGNTTISFETDQVSAICATCHSGRTGKAEIDAAIAAYNKSNDKDKSLSFLDVHSFPAAAVQQGTAAKVGYEYPGKSYAGLPSKHTGGTGCTDCHNPKLTKHTFAVQDGFSACTTCHKNNITKAEQIRMTHTKDYDGDVSTTEPLAGEISTLAKALLLQIQDVASSDVKICYEKRYPYWITDKNGDGSCDKSEAIPSNAYKAWTAKLLKAAHNYQLSQKDPGAWAHNFEYMTQLLYDSIEDLGGDVSEYTRP